MADSEATSAAHGLPEFVTLSRAALLLEVNERSARRAAGHLSDNDRQIRRGSPALVRLSALAVQMGKPQSAGQVSDTSESLSDKNGQAPDSSAGVSDTIGQDSDKAPDVSDTSESGLVDQLRTEVEYLRSALTAAQQIASQAQQLQLLAERRASELEGKALPAQQIEAVGTPDGPQAQESGIGGGITPSGQAEEPRRGFWSFLRRWW